MWSKTEEYQGKLKETLNFLTSFLSEANRPFVMFSGGKDSTVVLHLALRFRRDVWAFHWDYGPYLIPRWLEKEIIQNALEIGVKKNHLIVRRRPHAETSRENFRIGYRAFWGVLASLIRERGWDLCVGALRAEESSKRKRMTLKRVQMERGILHIYPIKDWTWKDVWAYIVSNKLPYASTYDKYGPILGWDKVRLVTFFDKEFEHFGSPLVDGLLMPEFRYPVFLFLG